MNFKDDLDSIENGIKLLDTLDDIKEIYHYTRIAGLKGIVETNNFWVSHSYFMNDPTEIRYTYQMVINELEKLQKDEESCRIKKMYDMLKAKIKETMNSEIDENYRINRSEDYRPSEFILSFSLNRDSLQLWAAFTGGSGYNIGLDFIELNKIFNDNKYINCIPGKVIYAVDRQNEIIHKKILEFKNLYTKYIDCLDEKFEKSFLDEFDSRIRLYTNFFKNPLFFSDEEFRIVFYNYKGDSYIKPNYRINNNILIPYIYSIQKEDKGKDILPLRSITVGPMNHSDIAEEGLAYFLNDLGYNTKDIKIKASGVSLRY